MFNILFIIAMFFAFAIGGEKGFGKGKRGLLLAVPLTLIGIGHISPWMLLLQPIYLWGICQVLKYDRGIEMVYNNTDPTARFEGMSIIAGNGVLIGLCLVIVLKGWNILSAVIISALAFCFVVRLSNDVRIKPYRDWLNKYMPNYPYLNFKDSWYVSCGAMGAILGLITILLK